MRLPEPDDVRIARSVMERHYGQPVRPVAHYCERLYEYADALDVTIERNATREAARQQLGASVGPFHSQADAETVRDALLLLRTWAYKSNALARLIYGDEPLRAEECPVHKGRWSGCEWPTPECGCDDGSNVTGWLRPVEGADRG